MHWASFTEWKQCKHWFFWLSPIRIQNQGMTLQLLRSYDYFNFSQCRQCTVTSGVEVERNQMYDIYKVHTKRIITIVLSGSYWLQSIKPNLFLLQVNLPSKSSITTYIYMPKEQDNSKHQPILEPKKGDLGPPNLSRNVR